MKTSPNSSFKRVVIFGMIAEEFFKISPSMLNGIFIWRVRREPNNFQAKECGDSFKTLFSVETGIVHNNNTTRFCAGTKIPFKPSLKPQTGSRPIKNSWSNNLISALCGNNICTLKMPARAHFNNPITSWGTPILTTIMLVATTFINIINVCTFRDFCNYFIEFSSFLFVAFTVRKLRFFNVIPSLASASAAPEIEPPKCLAISLSIANGFFKI